MTAASIGRLGAILLALTVVACAAAPRVAPIEPEGNLAVLGPGPSFAIETLSSEWAVSGRSTIAARQISLAQKDGVPALRVINDKEPFVVVRRTNTPLILTPYLSWAWSMAPYEGGGAHPVRLVIGFSGGARGGGSQSSAWLGSELPPHDRALSIAWGESALQRGTLTETGSSRSVPRYTVRGGREQASAWWLETLDLASLYSQAWPQDDSANVRIVFVGLAAEGSRQPSEADISGIQLSR
jgi:hypothetical protein